MDPQAIIFIAGKIRNGQFPKLPGFAYNEEFGKYLYQGRPLSLAEFNAAAETVLDVSERRFSLSVRLIPGEVAEKAEQSLAERAKAIAAARKAEKKREREAAAALAGEAPPADEPEPEAPEAPEEESPALETPADEPADNETSTPETP